MKAFKPFRYLFNLYKYYRYKRNPKYLDVVFDFLSGGLSCRSCNHHIPTGDNRERRYFTEENGGYTGQDLELECQCLLRANGFMSVLEDDHIMGENNKELTSLDMLINGSRADVRSITSNGANNILNGLKLRASSWSNTISRTIASMTL